MDHNKNTTERLRLLSSRVRLLADLMLTASDLQDVDSRAFAHVLQDIASQFERDLDTLARRCFSAHCPATIREERR